MARQIEN
jgi:chromosome condensin MukBEF MukE localization factor